MSNGDIGFWTGSFVYSPVWAPAPIALNLGATDSSGVDWLWMQIQGWDSPPVVGTVVQRASDHGGWATDQFFTPRPITLTIRASAASQAARDAARAKLQMVLPVNDLALLTYNEPVPKQALFRRAGQILETYPTLADVEFQCVLVMPDPRKYSAVIKNFTTLLTSSTLTGITLPTSVPFTLPPSPLSGSVSVSNSGNFETRPVITITGPIVGPAITLTDTNYTVSFSRLTLGAGDKLVINTDQRFATLNGSYRSADVSSAWWVLQPGSHTLQLSGATTGGASMQVTYQDAWI